MPSMMQFNAPLAYTYRATSQFDRVIRTVSIRIHTMRFIIFMKGMHLYYWRSGICSGAGDLVLMHGLTLHRPHPKVGKPYVRTTLHFDPSAIRKSLHPERIHEVLKPFDELGNCRVNLTGEIRTEFEALLHDLHQLSSHSSRFRQERMHIRVCDLLYCVAEICQGHVQEHRSSSEKKDMSSISSDMWIRITCMTSVWMISLRNYICPSHI